MHQTISSAMFEQLETRRLMAGNPLTVVEQPMQGGGVALVVTGTTGADQITLTTSPAGLVLGNTGGWSGSYSGIYRKISINAGNGNDSVVVDPSVTNSLVIQGGYGDDTVTGGSGNDRVYGGMGTNRINGGAGNDVLVSIGGSPADSVTGGTGRDSFWTDSSASEQILDATADENPNKHRVFKFVGAAGAQVSKDLMGQNLVDPKATSTSFVYRNFKTNELFSDAGPVSDDVRQGQVGNCYFLAPLSSIARVSPNKIQQSVVDLGDGTYAVAFKKSGADVFVRVDADLPTYSWGAPAYAGLGAQASLWTGIMEKAWAQFRTTASTYSGISGGWMNTVYTALGATNTNAYSASSATSLASLISQGLSQGKSVTLGIGTPKNGCPCVGGHAYDVVSVVRDAEGNITGIRLRNPWGVDGAGSDGANDGYVTATPAQVLASFLGVTIGTV